jgi:small multidrug resistance pump
MNPYLALALAISSEVIATSALKSSHGFTRIGPSALVVVGYAASFWLMGFTLKHFSVGTVYAIWSGIGTAAIAAIGWIVFKESLNMTAILGIVLIMVGVVVLNASGSVSH